jgi:hypothetical protein
MRPPLWQYAIILALFLLCAAMAWKLALNLNAQDRPAQVITAAATSVPAPTTPANAAATAYMQPPGTMTAVPVYAAAAPTVTTANTATSTGTFLSNTSGAATAITVSTTPTGTSLVYPAQPLRIRPPAPLDRG